MKNNQKKDLSINDKKSIKNKLEHIKSNKSSLTQITEQDILNFIKE